MKKQNPKKIFFLIIVLVLLLIIVFMFNSSEKQPEQQNSTSDTSHTNTNITPTNKQSDLSYVGNIFYINNNDSTQIFMKKYDTDPVLVFTDSDEDIKIKYAESISNNLNILTYMQSNDQIFGGSLFLISADGSGDKQEIVKDFVSNESPVISPDESLIAYVLFSNAEFNYGYSLYTMSIDGQNKTKLDTDNTKISNLTFDQTSSKIAYLKNDNIVVYDLDKSENSEIYKLKNQSLIGLSWNSDSLLITLEENSKTKILYYSNNVEDFGSLETTIDTKAVWADMNMDKIFYIKDSKLILSDKNNNIKEITESNNIIQWIK